MYSVLTLIRHSWRKSIVLSPTRPSEFHQLAKVQWSFASDERPTGESPIGEVPVTLKSIRIRPSVVKWKKDFVHRVSYKWCRAKLCHETAKEGTFSTVQSLLSSDSVHKVDPSEVWKIPKDQVLLELSSRVIAILLEFYHMARSTPRNRMKIFRPEILPTDSSICQ
jgi:hypothetical protein